MNHHVGKFLITNCIDDGHNKINEQQKYMSLHNQLNLTRHSLHKPTHVLSRIKRT